MQREKSILISFIYNFFRTVSSIAFPIITFSYASRILGAEGIGKVNFAKSVISYFSMFAAMGMNYYGTREAAKVRDNKKSLSKFVHEMLLINGCTTILSYVGLVFAIAYVAKLKDYSVLLIINSFSILMMGMGMDWLYQALEEYKYIALRSMLFQGIALIIMFITVRDSSDVVNYTIVSVIASSGSYILNFFKSRDYVDFHLYGNYEIQKHLRPIALLFALALSIELYTVLDSTMLGFICGDNAVGLYSAAIKINKIANTLITSLGVVLIPRLSYYIGKGATKEFEQLMKKAYNFVFMLSVPAYIGLFVLSDDIIYVFCGSGFETAGFTMRILTPIVLVIPFSVVTNQQTFVPMGKEKLILLSTCAGAVTNFTFNLLLIPKYEENGAAVATVLAETIVALICFINAKRCFQLKAIFREYYQYWIAALPIILIGVCVNRWQTNYVVKVAGGIVLAVPVYFLILGFFHNSNITEMKQTIKRKIGNKFNLLHGQKGE